MTTRQMEAFFDPFGLRRAWRPLFEHFARMVGDATFDVSESVFSDDSVEISFESLKVGEKVTAEHALWKGGLLYYFRSCGNWGTTSGVSRDESPRRTLVPVGHIHGLVHDFIEVKLTGPYSDAETDVHFHSVCPLYLGDVIRMDVEVTSFDHDAGWIILATKVFCRGRDEPVMAGVVNIRRPR